MSRPKLTLAMIVRDEEENLAQCLSSVRQYVDELIIVDTGSEDRTREVAVQFGASVHQFDHRNHPEAFFLDTAEENAKWGGPPAYSGMWCLSDFGAARAESWKHATGDYVMWMDADDVLVGAENLRGVVDRLHETGQSLAYLSYDYAVDHLGRVHYRQWRERIIRRGACYWMNPVHEVLMPSTPITVPPERFPSPVYSHRRKADRKQVPHRNYKILLRQVWQIKAANSAAQIDPRILFYLGQEARFIEPLRAVGFYEEYLQRSGWPEERVAAHMALGNMLECGAIQALPPEQAIAQAQREFAVAAVEMPENPDGLFGLARIAHMRQRWHDCVRYSEAGFKIGNTDTMLGTNPIARLYQPHIFYNYALSNIGRVEDALASCKAALTVMPDDPGVPGAASGMLTANVRAYEEHLRRIKEQQEMAQRPPQQDLGNLEAVLNVAEDVDAPPHPSTSKVEVTVIYAMQVWKQIIATGDGARARKFLESLPETVAAHPAVVRMWVSTEKRFPQSHQAFTPINKSYGYKIEAPQESLDVVFFLGGGPEPWDPNTPNAKGLGGSETAAIEVAKNLAVIGHRCVVFAEAMGTFDGVEYRHHSTFRGAECDVFISSRAPGIVDAPIEAKLRLLWVHDIDCGPRSAQMENWLYKFDRVLCLSNWHKQHFCSVYPTLHPDRVIVTRNGIDPARFTPIVAGVQQTGLPVKTNSLVFSSSPNRGLAWLLSNFRQVIRPNVPDAELHVFYGFDTWETFARRAGNQAELDAIEKFRAALPPLGRSIDGVFNHGKRPQREVADAYLRAKVWPYLTDFPETSCITAMEAMAAGAVPVYSAFAALPETVGDRGIALDNGDPQVANRQCEHIIRLFRDDGFRIPLAQKARLYALANLGWGSVAADWSTMFGRLIKDAAVDPMPLWRSA